MARLDRIADWLKLAEVEASLGSEATDETLSRHLPFAEQTIHDTRVHPSYKEMVVLYKRGQFTLWSRLLNEEQVDISRAIHSLAPAAVLVLAQAMEHGTTKEKLIAAKLTLEIDPLMERPVIRHEITQKFTQDELDKARNLVRRLKKPKDESAITIIGEPSKLVN